MTSNIFLKQITQKLEKILNGNLLCLLLIGSVKNKDETPFSDIDLVAIIKDIDFEQRRIFVESNRGLSIENNYKINTRLIKMLRDLLFLSGLSDVSGHPKEIVNKFIETYPNLLLSGEKKILVSLANFDLAKKNAYNTKSNYMEIRFAIINKINKCANKILKYEHIQR